MLSALKVIFRKYIYDKRSCKGICFLPDCRLFRAVFNGKKSQCLFDSCPVFFKIVTGMVKKALNFKVIFNLKIFLRQAQKFQTLLLTAQCGILYIRLPWKRSVQQQDRSSGRPCVLPWHLLPAAVCLQPVLWPLRAAAWNAAAGSTPWARILTQTDRCNLRWAAVVTEFRWIPATWNPRSLTTYRSLFRPQAADSIKLHSDRQLF